VDDEGEFRNVQPKESTIETRRRFTMILTRPFLYVNFLSVASKFILPCGYCAFTRITSNIPTQTDVEVNTSR
jgi:hypothetical protein